MTLKTVDLTNFLQGSSDEQSARAFLRATQEDGFAYIRGYQSIVPQDLVDQVFQCSKRFFELPVERKEKLRFTSCAANRGWLAVGREQASLSKDVDQINSERQSQPGQMFSE